MKKKPNVGELVICKIVRINPNSLFAKLEEYDLEGMVHISEVSTGWVRDIRHHVKIDQEVVAKVLEVDHTISLSLKRVKPEERIQKMKEFKLEQRAKKMLELVAKNLKKDLNELYEEIHPLIENFSLYKIFYFSLQKPEILKKYVKEELVNAIKEVAEKSLALKEFEFRAKLSLKSYKPEGINIIKDILKKAEKLDLEVRYISAPDYLIKYHCKDAKKGEKKFLEKLEKIVSMAKGEEVSFQIE